MTIDRREFLSASASALALGRTGLPLTSPALTPENPPPEGIAAREITVYTTADKTEYRLAATDTLTFKPMGQPLESQVCVFVDPTKRGQTILGIGGALTDASAEVFAKLPDAKQRELLDAYYDPNKGIGYTLGRTHIHSCDISTASYTKVDEGDKAITSFYDGQALETFTDAGAAAEAARTRELRLVLE